jgi:hypothetical protein
MGNVLDFGHKPKRKPKWYHRQLRTYTRMAYFYYTCTYCNDVIWPGELYDGYVVVSSDHEGKRKLQVYRYHNPACPNDPYKEDFEEEERRMYEESLKAEAQQKPKAMAKAA